MLAGYEVIQIESRSGKCKDRASVEPTWHDGGRQNSNYGSGFDVFEMFDLTLSWDAQVVETSSCTRGSADSEYDRVTIAVRGAIVLNKTNGRREVPKGDLQQTRA